MWTTGVATANGTIPPYSPPQQHHLHHPPPPIHQDSNTLRTYSKGRRVSPSPMLIHIHHMYGS